MFFLLSGYTMKKREMNGTYVNGKFCRFMVPYFWTCFAIIVADIFNSFCFNHERSMVSITNIISKDFERSFFASGTITKFGTIDLGTRIGAIWFLPAIFFAAIAFQFLINHVDDELTLGLCAGGGTLLGYVSAKFIWLPFSIQSALFVLVFIWFGFEIRKHEVLEKIKWYHFLIAQVILLLGIKAGYCNISFVSADINDAIISTIVGLSGCLLIYLVSISIRKPNLLSAIGQNSLTVLCTHLFALETMGKHFNSILDWMNVSGNRRIWFLILIEIVFAVGTAFVVKKGQTAVARIHRSLAEKQELEGRKRDNTIDVVKGILIISMIVGHFNIDSTLRMIIYSCHMIAFVFFSGYFYKKGTNLWHMAKSFLMPYGFFGVIYLFSKCYGGTLQQYWDTIKQIMLGMSFSKNVLTNVGLIGSMYFVLMLFIIRLLYQAINRIVPNDFSCILVCLCISWGGVALGKAGYWLPWSFDVACYAIIFYMIGHFFQKYGIMDKVQANHVIYFLLCPVWVYMIYAGSMEIAIRNYGSYGLVIIGSVCGVLMVYKFCGYINREMPVLAGVLGRIGRSTMYILIVHKLFGATIGNVMVCFVSPDGFAYLVICTVLQIAFSVTVVWFLRLFVAWCRTFLHCYTVS